MNLGRRVFNDFIPHISVGAPLPADNRRFSASARMLAYLPADRPAWMDVPGHRHPRRKRDSGLPAGAVTLHSARHRVAPDRRYHFGDPSSGPSSLKPSSLKDADPNA